jgi:hypothetical protein
MSNETGTSNPSHQYHHWYDPLPRWLVVIGAVGFFLAVGSFAVLTHTKELEEGWNRVRTWFASKAEPQPVPPAPASPAAVLEPAPVPQKTVVEVARPSLPCVDDAAEMMSMIRAVAGGDKYERTFNKHFKSREACFVLALTEAGTQRMHFATKQWWNMYPTYVVQPKFAADLKKFKVGTRLRITGELARYADATSLNEVDAILVSNARVTDADADGGIATGSIRR